MPRCFLLIGKRVRRQPLPEPEIIPLVSSSPRKTCNSRRRCTPACSAAIPAAASRLGKTAKHLRNPAQELNSLQKPLPTRRNRGRKLFRPAPQAPANHSLPSGPVSRRNRYSTTRANPVAGKPRTLPLTLSCSSSCSVLVAATFRWPSSLLPSLCFLLAALCSLPTCPSQSFGLHAP